MVGTRACVRFPFTALLLPSAIEKPEAYWLSFLVWFILVCLATPTLIGYGLGWIVRTGVIGRALARLGMSRDERMPSAWDFAFRGGRPGAFVRVFIHGADNPIAGRLGVRSLAGVSPHARDVYLEQQWGVDEDGWLTQPVPNSAGVWIDGAQIVRVEFYSATPQVSL